jgi:hypothetical protein
MTDVEEAERQGFINRKGNDNKGRPYSLPPRHPINLIYRAVVISGSLYGLHSMSVFHNVMHSPHVNHEWFKCGLAASIAVSMIKAYMELYEAKVRKQKVEYANYKNCTHAVLTLITIASFAFHKSLWDFYGGFKTMFIMFLFGWGLLLQVCLLLPTSAQNVIAFVGLTYFLQQYQ